ncbi:hypothetical protein Hte_003202 [Hypoxylon texense]
MSTDPSSSERLDSIEQSLEQLLDPQGAIDYESGFHHKGSIFINTYQLLFESLRELATRRPMIIDESDDTHENFNRAVALLDRIHSALARDAEDEVRQQLTSFPLFYYLMWAQVDEFAREPFANSEPEIVAHLINITYEVNRLASPPEQIWEALNAIENPAVQLDEHEAHHIFEDFMGLTYLAKPPRDEDACISLVNKSIQLCTTAAVALRLPVGVIEISNDDLYDDRKRPAYIDFPYNSDESSFGIGNRPGIIRLAQRLGSVPLPPKIAARLEEMQAVAGPLVEADGAVPDSLSTISEPMRKNRTVFADARAEKRRVQRFEEMARVRAIGRPAGSADDMVAKEAERVEAEDKMTHAAIDNFNQHGPKGIDAMVTESAFDQLLYMIIVTHWRCYQLLALYASRTPLFRN